MIQAISTITPTYKRSSFRSENRWKHQRCKAMEHSSAQGNTGPKTGTVGEERFDDLKVPGTYWWTERNVEGKKLSVVFDTDEGQISSRARAGDNVLRVAEACGAIKLNVDFCLEGTCELCLMEGKGLKETSWKANPDGKDVVRTCLTPFPDIDQQDAVEVKVLADDEIWNEGVV